MGLYNITYKNKETEKEINAEMGKPFGLIEKLKLGGIGSRRMIIENFSEDIKNLTLKVSGIQYANIELRPNGIIVHINQGIYTHAWTIPYFRLSVFNGDFFTIHGGGSHIQFNKEKSWKENKEFLQKIVKLKSEFVSV
ncbi:MAG: hypothetical protein VX883_04270 [Bacteroidota bacterium]|nr:hypothetical protein [Bacteroidota bacterium]MEC8005456.1 hypothetical protein [Bacteroidota bacterium]MEC8605907.1 hypothetical protein [Bacteroidota bacterium]MED6303004.1 hypothetical protein [Bacteroidota bacterium]MEE3097290.1 hypothetical protein [Bacteroidota bacterium]|tara:strand:- start:748 stop:1161 length:414 start_codon:yes stop_codon:yes gene_type:complete